MVDREQFLKDLIGMLGAEEDFDMDTDLMDIDEWDSFSMVKFLAYAKEKYNAEIKPFAIAGAVIVEDLYDALIETIEKE